MRSQNDRSGETWTQGLGIFNVTLIEGKTLASRLQAIVRARWVANTGPYWRMLPMRSMRKLLVSLFFTFGAVGFAIEQRQINVEVLEDEYGEHHGTIKNRRQRPDAQCPSACEQ